MKNLKKQYIYLRCNVKDKGKHQCTFYQIFVKREIVWYEESVYLKCLITIGLKTWWYWLSCMLCKLLCHTQINVGT